MFLNKFRPMLLDSHLSEPTSGVSQKVLKNK